MTTTTLLSSVAFIPDGNRRFAAKYGLSLPKAYKMGFNKAGEALQWVKKYEEIDTITIYTLSMENLTRERAELSIFLRILEMEIRALLKKGSELHENGVRVRIAGRQDLLPPPLGQAFRELETATEGYENYNVNLAVGYGGRQEIVDAANNAMKTGVPLTEDAIWKNLYVKDEPKLIIRTGNSPRLSGFLTWQSTYSELYFSKKLWPEFTQEDFEDAVAMYNDVEHNFGR